MSASFPDSTSVTRSINYTGNSVSVKDENGNSTSYDYDSFGNLVSVSDSKGNIAKYTYDDEMRLSTETNGEADGITYYTYDAFDRILTKTTKNSSGTVLYSETNEYEFVDAYDYTVYTDDMSGAKFRAEYSSAGRWMYAMHTSAITYNCLGTKVTNKVKRDSSNYVTKYQIYDQFGRLVEEDLGTSTAVYSYDMRNNAFEVLTNGLLTEYTYNYYGDVTKQSVNDGDIVSQIEYDLAGRKTKEYTPMGTEESYYTLYDYDAASRVVKVTAPLSSSQSIVTSYTYDSNSNVLTETTAGGSAGSSVTTYTYDSRDRVTKAAQGSSSNSVCTTYTYDKVGNVLTTTSGNGTRTVTDTYDSRNRLTKRTWPDGKSESYSYDLNNNMIKKVDRNGNTINYTYDGMSRMTKQASGSVTNTFTYNLYGAMASQSNGSTSVTYSYDSNGMLSYEQYTVDSSTYRNTYTYDSKLNLSALKRSKVSGSTVTALEAQNYTYDVYNRLTKVTEDAYTNGSKTSSTVTAQYAYNKDSNLTSKTLGNNVTTTYAYNRAGLTTSLQNKKGSTTLSGYTYTYYSDGNQKTKTDHNSVTTTYTYDLFNRLTAETKSTGDSKTYSYDTAGNRTGMSVTASSGDDYDVSYTYDLNNRLLNETAVYSSETKITDYTYDFNGNLTDKFYGTINNGPQQSAAATRAIFAVNSDQNVYERFTYNNLNQLTKYEAGLTTAEYAYRPDGMRYSKSVNGDLTYFGWSGSNINAEYDKNGSTVATYSRGVGLIRNSNNQYYVFDAHNDVIQLTNSSGTVIKDYEYDAFGNETEISEDDTNPFRYCSQYYDTETGFIYLRARYYDPSVGSFITEDPAFDGVNWYSYCTSNPMSFMDFYGTDAVVINKEIEGVSSSSSGDDGKVSAGIEHSAVFLQDENGTWYYFSWDGEDAKFVEVTDDSIFESLDSVNKFLNEEVYPGENRKPYTESVYIKGDFSQSCKEAQARKDNLKNGREKYNPVLNNCGEVVMDLLYLGILPSGTNLKTYYNKQAGYFKSMVPNCNMKNLQTAFYNSALNEDGFNEAIEKVKNSFRYKLEPNIRNNIKIIIGE